MTEPRYILTPWSITIINDDGQSQTVDKSHGAFETVRQAIRAGDINAAVQALSPVSRRRVYAENGFVISESGVTYRGQDLPPILATRVKNFWAEGAPFEPLLKFFERLSQNPSRRSIEQLYKFLEHGNMPIDENGFFLGYKSVRPDGYDWHTGTVLNRPGVPIPAFLRNEVDDDPNRGCSYGYHVGSLSYASSFGQRDAIIYIVRVDPANVVSVPHDCNHQKLRCTVYDVVEQYTGPLPETYIPSYQVLDDDYSIDEDCEYDEGFEELEEEELREEISEMLEEAQDALEGDLESFESVLARIRKRLDSY
jgi:hypothetical protein